METNNNNIGQIFIIGLGIFLFSICLIPILMYLVPAWYSSYKINIFSKQVAQLEQKKSEETTNEIFALASQIEEFGDKHTNTQAYKLVGRLYETLSQKGNGRASFLQFKLLQNKLKEADSIYIPYLKSSAEQGFPRGQYELALYYYNKKQNRESYKWLKKAEEGEKETVLTFLERGNYLKDISSQVKLTTEHRKLLNKLIKQNEISKKYPSQGLAKQHKTSNKTYQKCLFDNLIVKGFYEGVETFLYNNMACQIQLDGHAAQCLIYPEREDGSSPHCNKGGEWFTCTEDSTAISCCYNPNWECLIHKDKAKIICTDPKVNPVCTGKWID